jgi:hypothetical protein
MFGVKLLMNTHRPATNSQPKRVTLNVRPSSGTIRFGSTTHTQMTFLSFRRELYYKGCAEPKPACSFCQKNAHERLVIF